MAKIIPNLRTHADGRTSWHCIIEVGADPATGKRRQRRITARTKKECEALALAELAKVQRGEYVPPSNETVAEYLERWLAAVRPTVRPQTFLAYRSAVRTHAIPAFGSVALTRLSPLHLQDLYARKLDDLAPSSVRHLHSVLHTAFRQAVRWQLAPTNPADAVKPPSIAASALLVWTAEQARVFLAGTAADDLAALWRLALVTGMRKGELLALAWVDVDLDRRVLTVRRALVKDVDGVDVVSDPKTAGSRRQIALADADVAALKRHRARQAEQRLGAAEWRDGGYVFTRDDGSHLKRDAPNDRLNALSAELGLPRLRFHDLRHTAATLMIQTGVPIKVVSQRLGHTSIVITLNRYAHILPSHQEEAAQKMGDLLAV